jgi:hypothetical protein
LAFSNRWSFEFGNSKIKGTLFGKEFIDGGKCEEC